MQIKTDHTRLFFFALLIITVYVAYILLKPFLGIILLAGVTVMIFLPLYKWLLKKTKDKKNLSSALVIILILLVVLIPLSFIIQLTVNQTSSMLSDLSDLIGGQNINLSHAIHSLNSILDGIPGLEYRITTTEITNQIKSLAKPVGNFLINNIVSLGNSSIDFLPKLFIFIYLLAVLFPHYKSILNFIKKLSPLDDKLDQTYMQRIEAMTKAMAKGSLLIALIQSMLSGLTLWLVGVDYAFFWTIIMFVAALIPLGVGIVLIPIAIVLFLIGQIWQPIVILLVYWLLVSNVDNLLRAKLTPKEAELHPILVLLGIFGGIKLFGFLGFIYGPIIMILLVTTFQIYIKYYFKK